MKIILEGNASGCTVSTLSIGKYLSRVDGEGGAGGQGTDAAVVVPVRVDSEHGVAFETSFQDGVRHETLRSMCQLANACAMPLEVQSERCTLANGQLQNFISTHGHEVHVLNG